MIGIGLIGSTLLDQIKDNFNKIKEENGKELVFHGFQ